MTTKDIKADYSAAGDGQIATATLTISVGTKNLSATTNLWASGDVGKKIAIEGANTVTGENPLGALLSTISTFTDAQHIVIADNAVVGLSSASKRVEWGTNDNTAFTNFKNDFQGQTGVVLNVPAGRYCFASGGSSNSFSRGINGLTVVGSGSPVFTDMLGAGNGVFFGGAAAQYNDNSHHARTETVAAGSTTITLVTASDASLFSPNTYALMTGFDIQAFGYPTNPQWYEYVYITAVHTGAGGGDPSTITIQSPLRYTYKSTWPHWTSGGPGQVDAGGPATLYAVNPLWDCVQEYQGIVVSSNYTLFNCNGRSISFVGGSADAFGPNASQCQSFTLTDYSIANLWEIDKLADQVTLTNVTMRGFGVQSTAPNLLTMTNVTAVIINGTPRKVVMTNCTLGDGTHAVTFSPTSYGVDEEVIASGTSFAGIDFGGVAETSVPTTGAYSMSAGLITRLKSAGTGAPPQWAIPGANVLWSGGYHAEASFRIVDVWEDGTNVYISTSWPGSFPTYLYGGNVLAIRTHPAPRLTFTNCSGCDAAVAWSPAIPGRPAYSYWKKTYSGNIGTGQSLVTVFGKVVSVKINVLTAYAGANSPLLTFDGPFIIKSDGTRAIWSPSINLRIAGERVITHSGVTGTQSGDSGLALPDSTLTWLVDNQITPKVAASMADDLNVSVSIEIETDQQLQRMVAPLRLRLHA